MMWFVNEDPDDPVRVMVVDDQRPFRDAARAVIERLNGFEVVAEAGSGEDALVLASTVDPQLVLMDINMGGIDGIETTRQLVKRDPSVKVILLSTYQLEDLPPSARTCGAAAYVNKDDLGVRALRRLWASAGDPEFQRP
jgi:DNA-binding NarL/FixJ family response regulator